MTIVTMTNDDEEENRLEPETPRGTASSHLLGRTNRLDCNHEKKREGERGCVFCVGCDLFVLRRHKSHRVYY